MAFGGFDKAEAVKTGAKKSAKPAKEQVVLAGLEEVAALDAVIKALTAIHVTKAAEVKTAMTERFAAEGTRLGKRPENFRGIEGDASASCELRARAVTSPLKPEELIACKENKISYTEVVDTVATYVINPEYLTNMEIMSAVEEALKSAKGIPSDLFQKQEGKSKIVVADTAFDELFDPKVKRSVATVETLLGIVGVPAIKATFAEGKMAEAFSKAKSLLIAESDEVIEAA